MPIDPETLASSASAYAQGMSSIRGRRVQRLIKREFADAQHVLLVPDHLGGAAVIGLSAGEVAVCATNGKGPTASVVRWTLGSASAVETRFDLQRDTLPAVDTGSISLAGLGARLGLRQPVAPVPQPARARLEAVLRALS